MKAHTEPCVVPGCGRRRTARSWCHSHYEQWRRRGITPSEPILDTPARRLMAKVEKRPDGCWIWTGSTGGDGRYGRIHFEGRNRPAHRVAYILLVGPVSEDDVLDHLCRVTLCVNPTHLEPVTQAENIRRGDAPPALNARKTHCKRGHEFTPENTYAARSGGRGCRACLDLRCTRRGCGRMPEHCSCPPLVRGVPDHGTPQRYGGKYRCRCDECRRAWADYCQSQRIRRRQAAAA